MVSGAAKRKENELSEALGDKAGQIGHIPKCKTCGSARVVRDAWACFNPETGLWEIDTTFDHQFCQDCEKDTTFTWEVAPASPIATIRKLNDALRTGATGNGQILVTPGIREKGLEFVLAAALAVKEFNTFEESNDPWGEHDFGALDVQGEKLFWKIDYYNLDMSGGSEDPANEAVTKRVLTIMLAIEY